MSFIETESYYEPLSDRDSDVYDGAKSKLDALIHIFNKIKSSASDFLNIDVAKLTKLTPSQLNQF